MKVLKSLAVAAAFAVLAAVSTLPLAAPAMAQDEGGPMVIAVMDMNLVMELAKSAQSIRQQIDTRRQRYQDEIDKEETQLRDANEELARQRSILSPDAFKVKRTEFEEQFIAAQRKMQERKMELDNAGGEALGKIRDALKEVITDLVKQNNVTLILRKEQTVFAAQTLDITEVVIAELDKRLPSVKVFDK